MAEDAELLYHESRVVIGGLFGLGGITVTHTDLKSIAETGEVHKTSPHKGKAAKDVAEMLLKMVTKEALKEFVAKLDKAQEKEIKYISSITGKSIEVIKKELFKPNEDVVVDYKKARELGLATGSL